MPSFILTQPGGTGSGLTAGQTLTLTRADTLTSYTGTYRGSWASATAYVINDVVTTPDNGLYRCVTAHTSISNGYMYNRSAWQAVQTAGLNGGNTVPTRGLQTGNNGALMETYPAAGLFQRRPKGFTRKGAVQLWPVTAAADVVFSGSGTVADGTAVGGSVAMTSTATTAMKIQTATRTAFDMTGKHVAVTFKINTAASSGQLTVRLGSGSDINTNYISGLALNTSLDGIPANQWITVSLAMPEFTGTAGTGATQTAITVGGVAFSGISGATVEVSKIAAVPNVADKAKVVLWFDDGTFASHLDAFKILNKYGFPATCAYIADYMVSGQAVVTADEARRLQKHHGYQFGVHAYAVQDHNTAQVGTTALEQLASYQHFGMAHGLHGTEDMAYWSSGYNPTAQNMLYVDRMFRSGRSTKSRTIETLPPGDAAYTRALQSTTSDTSTATWQPWVNRAIACNGVAQFVHHDLNSTLLTELSTFCAWLDTQRANVDVVTAQKAFDPLS